MSGILKINNIEELYKCCKKELLEAVNARVGKREISDDITSDIFMAVMAHEKWFMAINGDRQRGYLYGVMEKICRMYAENPEGKEYGFREEMQGEEIVSEDGYEFIDRDEIGKMLSVMPQAERRAFEKRYIHNKSIEEISVEEGISVNAVSKRLSRARARLKSTIVFNEHDST